MNKDEEEAFWLLASTKVADKVNLTQCVDVYSALMDNKTK